MWRGARREDTWREDGAKVEGWCQKQMDMLKDDGMSIPKPGMIVAGKYAKQL